MCINCYHRRGRTKKAWGCPHKDKLHYSKGLCQNCYLAKYYQSCLKQKRKAKKSRKSRDEDDGTSFNGEEDEEIKSQYGDEDEEELSSEEDNQILATQKTLKLETIGVDELLEQPLEPKRKR